MDRPDLTKIVFTYEPDHQLVRVVEEEVRTGRYVVAVTEDALACEIIDAQMTIGPGYSDAVLARGEQLVWHHVPWAGVEYVSISLMRDRNVVLTNSSGISAPNMAEHAIAFILAFGRAFPTFFDEQQRRSWRGWDDRLTFFELTGQTVLLLGTGAIGKAIAARLRPFGCRIIGARRQAGAVDGFDAVVSFNELRSILPEVDHVVSSLPMTTGTAQVVDRAFFEAMKRGSYFYNVGRGGTVDQDALIEALHNRHIASAGLDVTDPEPLPQDSPLWDAPNTIITGHTSGDSPKYMERGAELLRANLRRYQSGEDLLNVVDLELGY